MPLLASALVALGARRTIIARQATAPAFIIACGVLGVVLQRENRQLTRSRPSLGSRNPST